MKTRLLTLASLRFYRRHPWQLLLAVAGIALGVAVFVGIELATDSARRAFELSSEAASGRVTHRLLALNGDLPETDYLALKRDRRLVASAPVLELAASLRLPDGSRRALMLEGLDIVEELPLRGLSGSIGESADPLDLLTTPGGIAIPATLAERYGIAPGAGITLELAGRERNAVVVGTTEPGPAGSARLIADIATAQELAGMTGRLSRVDLSLDEAAAAALAADPPAGTVLVSAVAGDQTLAELTRAFNTNLTALGLLALVVGMFLIYSTISFTIVQRWRSIAVLRAVGLYRRELLTKLLGEALAIGVTGTLAGLVLGRELSDFLLELVLRTLDDLYFRRALVAADTSGWIFVLSGVLGIGATLASALVPAILAVRREITSQTRSRLERSALRLARVFALAALPTLALAGSVLLLADRGLVAGFGSLFLVLAAGAMLIPLATHALMRLLETPLAGIAGLPGRMAARGVTDSLSRTGVATAALAVAVATVMSIGLMIGSFRASLIEWIDATITADLYVDLDPDSGEDVETILARIETLPGIIGLSRMQLARIATIDGDLSLRAQSPGPEGYGIDLVAPAGATNAVELLGGDASVLVAEPLAYREELRPGDSLVLPTPGGVVRFDVAGIYRDYNTAGAELTMALDTYRRHFGDQSLSMVGLHLAPGSDESATITGIRERLGPDFRARIRSTARIRDVSLVIFDQTFRVTEVMRLLAGIVAFLGILSALMALQLEREREFAVLRSLGMSIRQLFAQNLAQTGLLGLTAGLAAMPIGAALAWMLVNVINRRSFGWSMDFILTPGALLAGLLMAVAAALLAGLYPALVGARADMGLAWRDD